MRKPLKFISEVLVSFNRKTFDSSQKLILLMHFQIDELKSGLELSVCVYMCVYLCVYVCAYVCEYIYILCGPQTVGISTET